MKNNRKRGIALLLMTVMLTFLCQNLVYAFDDYEMNNTAVTAYQVDWQKTITAQISYNNDVDYYRFPAVNFNCTGYVWLTTPDNYIDYNLIIFDDNTHQIVANLSQNSTGAHTENATFNVIAGHQYIVEVGATNGYSDTDDYSFKLYF